MSRRLGSLFLLTFLLPVSGHAASAYAGAEVCAKCHTAIAREWSQSRHHEMMRAATRASVQGDFAQPRVTIDGSTYLLRQTNGAYYITESDLTGKPWEHRVDYTLGGRRVQHYLSTVPDGRIVVLSPTWDAVAKKWTREADIGNPEESGEPGQIWNKSCYGCHVSREEKNFDAQNLRYRTQWGSLAIDCETCHGPGAEHAAKPARGNIVNPARLGAARGAMVCAGCHSLRDIYADGFQAGGNYYDFYLPMMEYRMPASDNPAFWPDGRPRWFANEAVALWQSQCFLKGGATCATCHQHPHNPDVERNAQLRPDNNALCTGCHKTVAANLEAHTHHAVKSAGSSCIGCHMPEATVGLKARMRDHTVSIPVAVNTVRHGIPNACNECHRNRDAAWAARQTAAWYGAKAGRQLVERADAFTAARKGDASAVPALLSILSDPAEPPYIRANAAGYLGTFPNDPTAYDAVFHAIGDADPLVRSMAAGAIRPRAAQREAVAPALLPLLADPLRTVRASAALAMVAMGVQSFAGEDGQRYEQAKLLYQARAGLNADDAAQQFAAGKFFFLAGDMENAAAAFRASLKLDPATPARYLLARSLVQKGDLAGARQAIETIPREDPQYAAAQKLLAEVEASAGAASAAGDAKFLDAQVQFQSEHWGAELPELEEATRLAPAAAWAGKAQVYRAICLEKLARPAEAEAAIAALLTKPGAAQDVDLQLAYVELLFDTGRADEALKRVDATIAAAPDAPLAHFWRARLLLQLRRAADAAAAAEESVRLSPLQPAPHNLLIRIYQMLGRTKEAAEQAQWMRDYERRLRSR